MCIYSVVSVPVPHIQRLDGVCDCRGVPLFAGLALRQSEASGSAESAGAGSVQTVVTHLLAIRPLFRSSADSNFLTLREFQQVYFVVTRRLGERKMVSHQ